MVHRFFPYHESTGTLDPGFDGDGRVITSFHCYSEGASAIALQKDGKILLAGSASNGTNYDFALARYNLDGRLDTSFSEDGKVTTDFGYDETGNAIALQADSKIVVDGSTDDVSIDAQFVLARYNPDGSLDASFDGDGRVKFGFFSLQDDYGTAVALQADGKIVVAGYAYTGLDFDIALARLNPDGSLDPSFDGDGRVTTDIAGHDDVHAIAIQGDGKIVVAGGDYYAGMNDIILARYNPDGRLDPSFDGDGRVTTDILATDDYARDIVLQSDGKIVVAGGTSWDFTLVRYNPDGSLGPSFGEYGWVITDFFGGNDAGYGIALQANGKIIVAGVVNTGTDWDFGLARYNADGSLDVSLDGDGLVTTDVNGGYDDARDVVVQPDGRIIAAGITYNGTYSYFALVRYK